MHWLSKRNRNAYQTQDEDILKDIEQLREDLNNLAKDLGYSFHTKEVVPEHRVIIKSGNDN